MLWDCKDEGEGEGLGGGGRGRDKGRDKGERVGEVGAPCMFLAAHGMAPGFPHN